MILKILNTKLKEDGMENIIMEKDKTAENVLISDKKNPTEDLDKSIKMCTCILYICIYIYARNYNKICHSCGLDGGQSCLVAALIAAFCCR